jgi:hypothetical protein
MNENYSSIGSTEIDSFASVYVVGAVSRCVSRALTSQRRCADALSYEALEVGITFFFSKNLPLTPSTSLDVAR